jgi:hypothetical protein
LVNTPNFNNRETVFRGVHAEELSWSPTALTVQFLSKCSDIQVSHKLEEQTETRSKEEYKHQQNDRKC